MTTPRQFKANRTTLMTLKKLDRARLTYFPPLVLPKNTQQIYKEKISNDFFTYNKKA